VRLLIITGIFPPDIGGPATYVPQIATGLTERGHKVMVVTLSDHLDHEDAEYLFRVVRLPRRIFKLWRMFRTMTTIMRLGRQADVLFVNGLALEAVLANQLLCKPLVMKVVGDLAWERATHWGWIQDNFETFQQNRYSLRIEALKALRSWWTRQAHQVIVPSRYLARWVSRWGIPEERIAVIYNALDPMNGIEPLPVPLSTPVKAVTVGRLVPWKRVDRILEAIAKIPDLGLVVIGDGPERSSLGQQAASLGISDRVHFAGQRSREETLGLMASCNFFVLNSTYEGLPHVVLEAMALGLPVVATAVGGTPEVVKNGENGLLIPPGDGDAIIEALCRLCNDQFLHRRLSKGAYNSVTDFHLQVILEATERVLNEH